ncbi:MAG: hypothetical protein LBS52_05980 [Dysgonamonadaceae bacterium]|nr:hypothetical protein [Dysgonamonadaceae bacterium]
MVNTFKYLLVVIFLSYYLSATCFYHTHHFAWGTVTHSHLYFPFGDNPLNHTHTQTQCNIIALMSQFVSTGAVAALVLFVAAAVRIVYTTVYHYISYRVFTLSLLRAPPARGF